MKLERSIFENAVQSFDTLLVERFWPVLSDLLTSAFAQNIFFTYGPNNAQVNLCSEFYLGQYMNDPILLRFFPRDAARWARKPTVLLGDGKVRTRFAFSALFGFWGTPATHDPHRLCTQLLCEIESRVSLLRVHAMNAGEDKIVEQANRFEREYFVYFQELMTQYNAQPLLYPRSYCRKKLVQFLTSWWG